MTASHSEQIATRRPPSAGCSEEAGRCIGRADMGRRIRSPWSPVRDVRTGTIGVRRAAIGVCSADFSVCNPRLATCNTTLAVCGPRFAVRSARFAACIRCSAPCSARFAVCGVRASACRRSEPTRAWPSRTIRRHDSRGTLPRPRTLRSAARRSDLARALRSPGVSHIAPAPVPIIRNRSANTPPAVTSGPAPAPCTTSGCAR